MARASRCTETLVSHEEGGGRVAYYNVATLGLAGKVSAPLDRLEEVIDGGFRNVRWARQEPSLAFLRRDTRFEKMMRPFGPSPFSPLHLGAS
ncbi:hypothetical protein [uncultured Roseobacter sp.]|uniref:hypothetical protein n=1 Tax=uncultured Roseobacter sp. TaxID=114847 RepID=UPI00260E9F56|nr:hypothetical protein [uncultured Roseobacter sp.]